MALGGLPVRSYPYNNPSGDYVGSPNGLLNQYNLYGKAVHQGEQDYSGIMEAYRRLLLNKTNQQQPIIGDYKPEAFKPIGYGAPEEYKPKQYGMNIPSMAYKPPMAYSAGNMAAPERFTPKTLDKPGEYRPGTYDKPGEFNPQQYGKPEDVSPILSQYKQSSDLTDAIGKLKNLSETGGYDAQGIADLRERGISPLRSVYANAQREIDRSRAIQGSSASYAALKSKMARELSDKIAGATQNVNAGIAQNVAGNKLQASPIYASVTGQQSDLQNQIGRENASILTSANAANVGNRNRVNEANVDTVNRGNLYNIGRADETGRANVDLRNQGNLYNLGRTDDVNRTNTDLINQGNLFNIGRTDAFNKTMFDRSNDVNDRNVSGANDTNRMNTDLFNRDIAGNNEIGRANVDLMNQGNLRNIGAREDISRANTDLFNSAIKSNVQDTNEGRRINLELPFKRSALGSDQNNQIQQILEGMKGLYGTTPAMASLFGNQAMQGANLQNTINQGNNQNAMEMIMQLMRALSGRN
jgi:hypothetical protein